MKLPRNVNGDQFSKTSGTSLVVCLDAAKWKPSPDADNGTKRTLITIPMHRPIKAGTLSGVLKEIAAHKSVDVETVLEGL